MNWKAFEKWAGGDHFDASSSNHAAIERNHYSIGLGKVLGNRQNRLVESANDTPHATPEVVLCMFCRFTAPPQNKQAYVVFLLDKCIFEISMSPPYVR